MAAQQGGFGSYGPTMPGQYPPQGGGGGGYGGGAGGGGSPQAGGQQLPWWLRGFAPQQQGLDPAMRKQIAQQGMTQMGLGMMAQSGPRPRGTGPSLGQGLGQAAIGAMQHVKTAGQQAYQNQMSKKQMDMATAAQERQDKYRVATLEAQEKRYEAQLAASEAQKDRDLKQAELTAGYREKMVAKGTGADAKNYEIVRHMKILSDPEASPSQIAASTRALEGIQSGYPYGSALSGFGNQNAGLSMEDQIVNMGLDRKTQPAPTGPPIAGQQPFGGAPPGGGLGQTGALPNLNDPNFLASAMQNRVGGMPTQAGLPPPAMAQPQQQNPGEYFGTQGRYGGVGNVLNFLRNSAGGGMGPGPRRGQGRRRGYAGAGSPQTGGW